MLDVGEDEKNTKSNSEGGFLFSSINRFHRTIDSESLHGLLYLQNSFKV